jgi:Putative beta-barrel porin-2, OmpL-like. bbp2
MFKTMAVLALASSVSFAGADKDMKKVVEDQGIYVETAKPGVVLSGYVDAGYTYNFNGPTARTSNNTRVASDNSVKGDFNVNAFKLAIEKPLGDKNEFAAGFRADLMYGEDASFVNTNANSAATGVNGLGTGAGSASDFALEQAFVQFRAPIGNGIDFKVGKFVTFMGYEVIERPANMNITYGNLFNNMIPLAHTGAAASYKFSDIVDVKGAVVNGWNDDNLGSNGTRGDGYGLLGAVNVNAPGGNANIQNSVYLGFGGDTGVTNALNSGSGTVVVYDVWGNWKPKFANDKLLLGFNTDYGQAEYNGGTAVGAPNLGNDQWYGLALYAKYQFTEIFSLASRADYIHSNNGAKFGPGTNRFNPGGSAFEPEGNEIYSYTLTAGFDVWENMLLRAEYRADVGNDWVGGTAAGTAGNGRYGVSHLAAVQVVYSF